MALASQEVLEEVLYRISSAIVLYLVSPEAALDTAALETIIEGKFVFCITKWFKIDRTTRRVTNEWNIFC